MTFRKFLLSISASAIVIILPFSTFAQNSADAQKNTDCILSGSGADADTTSKCIDHQDFFGSLDLVAPENALFSLMGATPENVIKPKVGEKFSMSLLPQAVDALGNEQFSIGIEVNPGMLMMPDQYTLSEFIGKGTKNTESRERVERINDAKRWSKFTLNAMASRTTGGQEISKYGYGVNYVHDTGSPLNAQKKYANCIDNDDITTQLNALIVKAAREVDPVKKQQYLAEAERFKTMKFEPVRSHCQNEAEPWNRDVYSAGLAIYHSNVGAPNEMAVDPLDQSKDTGYGIWTSIVKKVGTSGQLTGSVRYTDDLVRERKDGEESISESVDGWQVGGRYTHHLLGENAKGKSDRAIRGFLEVGYTEEEFGLIDDSFTQVGFGIEAQIQDNLFFQATIGDTFGSEIDRSTYLSGQFKWAFSKAAAK